MAEIKADDGSMQPYFGKYSTEKARGLASETFNRHEQAERGLQYERLDQLTNEVLLDIR